MATLYTHIKTVLYSIIFVVVVLNVFFLLSTPTVHSGATDNLTGYAWSDTIGWISFNSTNEAGPTADYGVTVASDGDMSGYAWSEHIGWISFNEAGCPSGTCAPHFDKVTGAVTGWARALSPTSGINTGGWDGWISLSGTATDGSPYGVVASGTDWGGYAWGSDVVGWISFGGSLYGVTGTNNDSIQVPLASITQFEVCDADGTDCVSSGEKVVLPGAPLKINWDATATECQAMSGSNFSTSNAPSGTDLADANATPNTTEDYRILCTNNGVVATGVQRAVQVTTTQVILSVSPRTVEIGGSTNLSWDIGLAGDEATCTLSGGRLPADIMLNDTTTGTTGVEATSGTYTISPITARTTYTVTCGALTDTETVEVVPRGTET